MSGLSCKPPNTVTLDDGRRADPGLPGVVLGYVTGQRIFEGFTCGKLIGPSDQSAISHAFIDQFAAERLSSL